jgi:nitroimidazol reductase NimA-like FMN-containing flavoprotein (pyridoxamine 5'-phosphate oxidase superfamily)
MDAAPPEGPALTHDLDRAECLELLGYGSYVGHVGFTREGRQMILPVNYLFESEHIYVRTAEGSLLSSLDGSQVAFEVDSEKPLEHSGWSVLVNGSIQLVSDTSEIDRLRRGPLRAWARHSADRWLRISLDSISGRRVGDAD